MRMARLEDDLTSSLTNMSSEPGVSVITTKLTDGKIKDNNIR